jgi:choline dehydrogenase-like flavoprotein
MHVYSPWWLYKEQAAGKLDFPRGYHIEVGARRPLPEFGSLGFLDAMNGGVYGRRLKEDARRYYGSTIDLSGRGEMIPNDQSYCEIDPNVKDAWGIPVLRFRFRWSEHELKQGKHMIQTFRQIIEKTGGRVLSEGGIAPGGAIIHEVGTTCMGADARNTALNSYCQAWDTKNLLVCDGGPFVSNADKNPTLTIMALAWRTCDHLLEEMRQGNV